jgi:AraC-like DNA-binding protein
MNRTPQPHSEFRSAQREGHPVSTVDAIPLPSIMPRRLARVGIDMSQLLREAGLSPTLLPLIDAGRARVGTGGYFALWRALERLDSDPALGLRLTQGVERDQLDLGSMSALHAATFGDAIAVLQRYKRLTCPESVQVTRHAGESAVEFRWLLTGEAPPAPLIDACLATVLALGCTGTALPLRPTRVQLARDPRDRAVLESHFGCEVVFHADANRIVFDDESMSLPFRTANADVLAVLLPGLEAALAQLTGHGRDNVFIEQVRGVIRRQMPGRRAMVGTVAASLALSSRTLQRRLGENGSSFQRLMDGVRHQVALELLRTTALDNGEIACLLGFEELNSFHRAFVGWEGLSPLRWRNGLSTGEWRRHRHSGKPVDRLTSTVSSEAPHDDLPAPAHAVCEDEQLR